MNGEYSRKSGTEAKTKINKEIKNNKTKKAKIDKV